MTDIELLPLPEPLPRVLVHVLHEGDMELEAVGNYYAAEQVRACVAHATAAKDAEIEALKERDEKRGIYICEQWEEIEALRAELREAWSAVDSKAGWEWKKRAEQAEARAERLAEALRELVAYVRETAHHNAPAAAAARAALRDHDQEGKDG